jgi:hypothetical protein
VSLVSAALSLLLPALFGLLELLDVSGLTAGALLLTLLLSRDVAALTSWLLVDGPFDDGCLCVVGARARGVGLRGGLLVGTGGGLLAGTGGTLLVGLSAGFLGAG